MEKQYVQVRKSVEALDFRVANAERLKLVHSSQLFAGLSLTACTEIAERARPKTFGRNELVFMQGQEFGSLVLIESGCIKLTQLSPSGREVILGLRGTGEVVDLPVGSQLNIHTYTARVLAASKALTWNSATLKILLATIPAFQENISAILTSQLHELQQRYHEMASEGVERRVACALIRLSKQFGKPTHMGLEVSISRQELAQMTGTTLFTVSRMISKWAALGLVEPRREAVMMLDAKGLDLVSSMDQQTQPRSLVNPMKRATPELRVF